MPSTKKKDAGINQGVRGVHRESVNKESGMPRMISGFLSGWPFMEILELLANPLEIPNIPLAVPEVQEVLIPFVGTLHTAEMLDRAPVLLGAGGDLDHIGQDSVRIGAVLAVDLLNQIQIREMVSVKGQIFGASDPGDPVDRKADPLVGRTDQIQQGDRDQTRVDDRDRQQNQESRAEDIVMKLFLQ